MIGSPVNVSKCYLLFVVVNDEFLPRFYW